MAFYGITSHEKINYTSFKKFYDIQIQGEACSTKMFVFLSIFWNIDIQINT